MTSPDPSAILEGRTTSRHSVPLIIGLVGSGVCLLIALGIYVLLSFAYMTGPLSVIIGIILALPTAAIMVGAVLFMDRLEPEPKTKLAFVFLWGAGPAILVAFLLNSFVMAPLFTLLAGKALGDVLAASVGAPLVEETCKGAVLLLLLLRRRDEIDGPTDGIIYAAMVGLGFALVENVLYYFRLTAEPLPVLGITFFLRGIGSPLAHPLFTSMTGLGIAYAANRRGSQGVLAIIGGWIAAMFLHGLWNFGASLNIGPRILLVFTLPSIGVYLILACVLVGLIVILVRDRRRIVGLIQRYLPPYGQYGIVTPSDLQMLATLSARRAARGWASGQFGPGGRKAMGEYQLAATELALLHSHAETRTVEPRRFAIRRDQLVGLMRATRSVFAPASGPPQVPPGPGAPGPAGPAGPPQAPYGGRPQAPYGPPGGQQPYGGQTPYGGQPQPPYGQPPQGGRPPYGGPPR